MNKSHKVSKTKDRRLVDNLSAIAKQIKREYFYMSDKCLDTIISRVPKDVESVLVVDDAGLQVVRKLYDLGIKDVTLTFYTYDKEDIFDNFVYIINNTFRDLNVKLVSFREAVKMKFDLVISNPPYGKIGAQITKKIIDDVDYKDFINLLPANDYLKADGVFNYVKTIEHIPGFGEDANVLPTICEIVKNNLHNYSKLDIYTKLSSNDLTYKYFSENNKRENVVEFDEDTTIQDLDFSDKLIFGVKVSANAKDHSDSCNIQGSAKGIIYAINNKFKTLADHYAKRKSKALWGVILKFNSSIERDNAFKFIYSDESGRFCNMLITSMHKDNMNAREHSYWFPKVDWTREWTVEEILREYDYTNEEIKEVIEDLENFKGMKD